MKADMKLRINLPIRHREDDTIVTRAITGNVGTDKATLMFEGEPFFFKDLPELLSWMKSRGFIWA